jgi:alpha-1,6-mannosyltransferase
MNVFRVGSAPPRSLWLPAGGAPCGIRGWQGPERGIWLLGGLGVALLLLTTGGLALHVPGSAGTMGTLERTEWFVALLCLAALVHFAAVATVLRGVPGGAIWLVVLVALAARIGPLVAPPNLSSDVYRYVWDGRVQAAGVNPYSFVPADPALAPLRDADVFPHVNRAATAPTIYPPAAQMLFAVIGWAVPGVTGVKAMMVVFEALALAAAAMVLRRAALPISWLVVWAWNPLAIWAFAGNGHVDAAATGLLAVALMLIGARRGLAAGLVFAAAILTKFLPLAVAPVFWHLGRWYAMAATCATIVGLYACYASAGPQVLGFLPGYGAEEGLTDGTGVWLLAGLSHLVTLPRLATGIYFCVAASLIGALGAWVAFVKRPTTDTEIWRAAGSLMACVTFAISPHYSWYFVWLALPAIVAPSRALIWLSTAPVLLYLDPFHERFFWPSLVWLPAFALALVDLRHPLDLSHPAAGELACPP